ncbi:MAG: hypothetical protein HY907_00720 [Deltaproteobacteria bacterium]|nr:hypothetical protein [Deltaproteobacteria bacterium]
MMRKLWTTYWGFERVLVRMVVLGRLRQPMVLYALSSCDVSTDDLLDDHPRETELVEQVAARRWTCEKWSRS